MRREADVSPVQLRDIAEVHHHGDVLVIGGGCAGMAAAVEAQAGGAAVTVLERAGAPGGSSALSGGEIYLGGGTEIQRACGYEDDADNMSAFLCTALGPDADEEKIRAYCDGSLEHYQWFVDLGVPFNPTMYDGQTWMPPTEDGLFWLGENAWPYNQVARAVPRGHRPATKDYGGWIIMDRLVARAKELGVTVETDIGAERLILDGDRVVGVIARRYGDDFAYVAARGVVLTTGGFADNDEMMFEHASLMHGHDANSDGNDDGSGILMGAAAGAATRRMSITQAAMTILPAVIARGMLVNAQGQRFINEDVYPGLASVAAVTTQPAPYWVIIDEVGFESVPARDLWGVRPRYVAESLAELEQETGLPAGSLEYTVGVYNRDAAAGHDAHFHKDPRWMRELTPPFAAIDPAQLMSPAGKSNEGRDYISAFTLGGLHTTVDGLVLNLNGQPIPGLYAAGRASSGMHGRGYISGTSVGDGTFFGRRVGQAIVATGEYKSDDIA